MATYLDPKIQRILYFSDDKVHSIQKNLDDTDKIDETWMRNLRIGEDTTRILDAFLPEDRENVALIIRSVAERTGNLNDFIVLTQDAGNERNASRALTVYQEYLSKCRETKGFDYIEDTMDPTMFYINMNMQGLDLYGDDIDALKEKVRMFVQEGLKEIV